MFRWMVLLVALAGQPIWAQATTAPSFEERLGKLEKMVELLRKNQDEIIFFLRPPKIRPGMRPWGPEQATGTPDTRGYGDLQTAWATQNPDGGPEWLELSYDQPRAIQKVRVYCTFNPGALVKVTALSPEGREVVFWEGEQSPKDEVDQFEVFSQSSPVTAQKIKLYLDTQRKKGWNEIDAVEVITPEGASFWAKEARASSFYGEGAVDATPARPGPLKNATTPFPADKLPRAGDIVGVKWNTSWWSGKILEARPNQRFQITYVGWDESWNEEVGLDRLGESPEAVEIASQLKTRSQDQGGVASVGGKPVIRKRKVMPVPPPGSVSGGGQVPEVGSEAPGFEIKTMDDKTVRLADYRGKYVLLDFWATWCGPCRGETPNLKAVFEKYGRQDNFVMIGLSLDADKEKPQTYAKENGTGWIDGFLGDWGKDEVTKKYGVRGIPSIWLIGPDGKIVAKGLRGERIMEVVRSALEGGKS